MYFPLFNQIDSSLFRETLSHLPALPNTRGELNLPRLLKEAFAGKTFHMFSSPNNDLIIFYTEENIHKLSKSRNGVFDGTFKSVPHIYFQLFIPLIYRLLSEKSQAMYCLVFRSLNDKADI